MCIFIAVIFSQCYFLCHCERENNKQENNISKKPIVEGVSFPLVSCIVVSIFVDCCARVKFLLTEKSEFSFLIEQCNECSIVKHN